MHLIVCAPMFYYPFHLTSPLKKMHSPLLTTEVMLSTVYENIKILNSDYFIICIVRILKTREKTLMLLMF